MLDYAKGRNGGTEWSPGMRNRDAGRISAAARSVVCVAGGGASHPVRETLRRVLSVSRRIGIPLARWHPDDGTAGAGVARRRARRGDTWRSIRCAGIPAHLVRHLDRRTEARHRAHPHVHAIARKPQGRRGVIAPKLDDALVDALVARLGAAYVKTDEDSRTVYGTDALKRGRPADVVVLP